MEILTGFVIGLFGSLHCVGMCGPIALALPIPGESKAKLILSRISYNLGRVITYSFLGAVFGLFGNRLILIGLQSQISIIVGVIILLAVLIPRKWRTKITSIGIVHEFNSLIKSSFSKLFKSKSQVSFLYMGILNGFLPCGFVYIGIAGAVATADVLSGTLFMMMFGLGTFPIMFFSSIAGNLVSLNLRRRITKIIPALTIVLALLFIVRGLGLGIPYLSPKLSGEVVKTENAASTEESCH